MCSQKIKWLQFNLLSGIPKLKHAVLLRQGGCSQDDYASLNLSDNVGDNPDFVEKNLLKVKETLAIEHLFWAHQCHGKHIHEVNNSLMNHVPSADALVTNIPHCTLMVTHADCQATIMYDPIHNAIANVHAGWRGSVQNIFKETIEYMRFRYGSHPQELLVCISPSLGPENAQFIHYKQELPEPFWHFQHRPEYFNFWEISRMQLERCGVLSHHIEISGIDTHANSTDFFSYRRDKKTGRHGTLVTLV